MTTPATMRHATFERPGPPEVIVVGTGMAAGGMLVEHAGWAAAFLLAAASALVASALALRLGALSTR